MAESIIGKTFMVVARPFYTVDGEEFFDVDDLTLGSLVVVEGEPDSDGDVTVKPKRAADLPRWYSVDPSVLALVEDGLVEFRVSSAPTWNGGQVRHGGWQIGDRVHLRAEGGVDGDGDGVLDESRRPSGRGGLYLALSCLTPVTTAASLLAPEATPAEGSSEPDVEAPALTGPSWPAVERVLRMTGTSEAAIELVRIAAVGIEADS